MILKHDDSYQEGKQKITIASTNFWPIKILVMAIALSLGFSLFSELIMDNTGIIIALIVIVVFVSIAIITDMIGVAVTACSAEAFVSKYGKDRKGVKEGVQLIRNADKVASLCADVLGDVCGILSGAAGANIVARITLDIGNINIAILISSLTTAIIAGLTIFGKALGKHTAINKCDAIILRVGKIISLFTKGKNSKKQM